MAQSNLTDQPVIFRVKSNSEKLEFIEKSVLTFS